MGYNERLLKHELLTAICKKSFLYIRYTHPNTGRRDTLFWIGINALDIEHEKIQCYGYNLDTKQSRDFNYPLQIKNITEAKVVDETYYSTKESESLLHDIKTDPEKYEKFFGNYTENLNILDYYDECLQLNNTPYLSDDTFQLIKKIDEHNLLHNKYVLTDEQFYEIVGKLDKKLHDKKENKQKKTLYLCLNVLTIRDSQKGNYVVAFRKLTLNIRNRSLKMDKEITICKSFQAIKHNENHDRAEHKKDYEKNTILHYFDNGDLYLLEDFEHNQEKIKDILSENLPVTCKVDDNPYIFPLQRNLVFSLKHEFAEIRRMHEENCLTEPLKAFFGRLINIPEETPNVPIVLLDDNVNLKQLLAIHNAMKNPVSYIQGPPGTGKTSTIVNTILTAFFNNQTILFTAYNNKPIDGVTEKLKKITYKENPPLFPFLVIKNNKETPQALAYARKLYENAKTKTVQKEKLEVKKNIEIHKTQQITALLYEYEKQVELDETSAVLDKMIDTINSMQFNIYLQGIEQKQIEEKRKSIKAIDCEKTIRLINENKVNFFMYIYFKTVELLQQLDLAEYKEFEDILFIENEDEQVKAFNQFINEDENIYKLLKVFPIILTTCISAKKIGNPKQYFDITIMDEASQCDNATAIIPIIRGKKLMLVGDPNQLNPVIVMDRSDNEKLKQEYQVPNSYDFMDNSVYKTFISNDSISNETLLSYHYRCTPKIIEFNNKKYYNSKLNIETKGKNGESLKCIEIGKNETLERNTSPEEIKAIVDYVKNNKDKNIGIITPFRKQREGIVAALKEIGINAASEKSNITCGTVHSFQGDEKDQIIFSLALTNKTSKGTYNWLKCNKELINVATSRGKDSLILMTSSNEIERLHNDCDNQDDDMYELYQYVKTNGTYNKIKTLNPETKALGLKAFSTETENDFLNTLEHALSNLNLDKKICVSHEVPLSAIFEKDFDNIKTYFLEAKFDFVVFYKGTKTTPSQPLFAFEVDGIEHKNDRLVIERDKKKQKICDSHNFTLIRVPNSYARRYKYIKKILKEFFENNK